MNPVGNLKLTQLRKFFKIFEYSIMQILKKKITSKGRLDFVIYNFELVWTIGKISFYLGAGPAHCSSSNPVGLNGHDPTRQWPDRALVQRSHTTQCAAQFLPDHITGVGSFGPVVLCSTPSVPPAIKALDLGGEIPFRISIFARHWAPLPLSLAYGLPSLWPANLRFLWLL
jgi:hypothetical protein